MLLFPSIFTLHSFKEFIKNCYVTVLCSGYEMQTRM